MHTIKLLLHSRELVVRCAAGDFGEIVIADSDCVVVRFGVAEQAVIFMHRLCTSLDEFNAKFTTMDRWGPDCKDKRKACSLRPKLAAACGTMVIDGQDIIGMPMVDVLDMVHRVTQTGTPTISGPVETQLQESSEAEKLSNYKLKLRPYQHLDGGVVDGAPEEKDVRIFEVTYVDPNSEKLKPANAKRGVGSTVLNAMSKKQLRVRRMLLGGLSTLLGSGAKQARQKLLIADCRLPTAASSAHVRAAQPHRRATINVEADEPQPELIKASIGQHKFGDSLRQAKRFVEDDDVEPVKFGQSLQRLCVRDSLAPFP